MQILLEIMPTLYKEVVDALQMAADLFIPKHRKFFYKFWWYSELDVLILRQIL